MRLIYKMPTHGKLPINISTFQTITIKPSGKTSRIIGSKKQLNINNCKAFKINNFKFIENVE